MKRLLNLLIFFGVHTGVYLLVLEIAFIIYMVGEIHLDPVRDELDIVSDLIMFLVCSVLLLGCQLIRDARNFHKKSKPKKNNIADSKKIQKEKERRKFLERFAAFLKFFFGCTSTYMIIFAIAFIARAFSLSSEMVIDNEMETIAGIQMFSIFYGCIVIMQLALDLQVKKKIKKRIIETVLCIGLLWVFFYICRYPLYGLHRMGEWPFNLFIFGLIVLAISSVYYLQKVMITMPIGYMIGFIIGALFNVDSEDGLYNNFWLWWGAVFLICIAGGITWEIVCRRLKAQR